MIMKEKDADILFQYLKDILYERGVPMLSEQEVSAESAKLVDGMNLLHGWLKEGYQFATDISEGILNGEEPSKDNPLCGPLKMLRSNFVHLVWQTKQVASGDYSQQVAMMGDFSAAFNTMTEQLMQRESALREHNELLSYITDNIGEYVVVLDRETKDFLHENKSFLNISIEKPELVNALKRALEDYDIETNGRFWEISISSADQADRMLYYHVDSFHINWKGKSATAYLLRDITERKEWESSIEYAANSDVLTKLYNRRYCINTISKYIEEQEEFLVCFIDLDKLKEVNDTFGHCLGDEYIVIAADILMENAGRDDIICRIGGDEFIIIMRGYSEEQVRMRMEQIRKQLFQLSKEGKVKYLMNLSYGIARYNKNNMHNAEEIMHEADKNMYLFKRENRRDTK
ncbi:sensor domain-containing diguanylate cyclase [Kineothrix sp. MB12-C1]|uniref:sensor domain-containing diguanylate cyclase n=1 Tax=Kineothrix sp. MB12-C1 TaxID=3070215 RepID=UPI0027D1FC89|nr:diguanylate cyclase [Kineothrix sp. MB12-C1]WMC93396.1 diguanylate cyclase [Kineothrix sp. MB12-C1]